MSDTHTSQPRMATIIFIIIPMFTGITGATVRPVVTFTPPWNKILKGDAVRMTCDVAATVPGHVTYTWYRNTQRTHTGKTFTIQSALPRHGGEYQCGTSEDNISEAATLSVTSGLLVLQAPPYLYEGDDLPLRCHSGSGNKRGPIVFYRNNEMINPFTTDCEILVRDHRDETAIYRCTEQEPTSGYSTHSDETDLPDRGAAASFVVTSHPNWRKIFTGEPITMYCDGDYHGPYDWYKDGRSLRKTDQNFISIQSAQRSDSGRYWCGTSSGLTPAVSLDVSDGPVILQAPLYVYDGGNQYLRCSSRPHYSVQWTKFYKDDKLLYYSESENLYSIPADMAGRYRCERKLYRSPVSYTDSVSVPIRELFSSPEMRLTPSNVTEGDGMTMTCVARLSPSGPTTGLQFAFYRDGREVRGFTPSNKYEVLSAQLEDSGNYSCRGRTSDERVIKLSQELWVYVQKNKVDGHDYRYLYPTVSVALLVILSALLIFRYRHRLNRFFSRKKQTKDQQPRAIVYSPAKTASVEEISYMDGRQSQEEDDDVCYTTIKFPPKALSHKVTDTVIYSAVKIQVSDP